MRSAALALALVSTGCCDALVVQTSEGELTLCVEVAETETARIEGLRGRDPLGPGEALHLPFPVEGEVCVVNDGVSFAIDALYADPDGAVVAVERGIPAGDATGRCHRAQHVVETAAGELDAVDVGDRLLSP